MNRWFWLIVFLLPAPADPLKYRIPDTYPAQSSDVSYGRLGDAAPWWVWFRTPSPNQTNSTQSAERQNLGTTSIISADSIVKPAFAGFTIRKYC